ncbi:MAG: hypothetical protein IK080_03410 [Clostridia bacterium]|nr:hypothetical protein [Clostridia bacterium]
MTKTGQRRNCGKHSRRGSGNEAAKRAENAAAAAALEQPAKLPEPPPNKTRYPSASNAGNASADVHCQDKAGAENGAGDGHNQDEAGAANRAASGICQDKSDAGNAGDTAHCPVAAAAGNAAADVNFLDEAATKNAAAGGPLEEAPCSRRSLTGNAVQVFRQASAALLHRAKRAGFSTQTRCFFRLIRGKIGQLPSPVFTVLMRCFRLFRRSIAGAAF